jgi:hypothetical protein
MAARKNTPTRLVVGGDTYRATLMMITAHDQHGRPSELRVIQEDESVDLSGEVKEFLVAYVQERMFTRAPTN